MKKLIIPIFEGINPELLFKWIDAGFLPNFKRLYLDGYLNVVKGCHIPYESSGLVTAFSGLSDYDHGILAYFKVHNSDYIPKLWNSSELQDKFFWNKSEFDKFRFCIINVFGTDPVYKINGYMISYAMRKSLHYSYPSSLLHDLSKENIFCIQDTAIIYSPAMSKHAFFKDVLRVEELRHKTFQNLFDHDLDIYIVNYTLIDRVSHFYYCELSEKGDLSEKVLFQAYKHCDNYLHDILEKVESGKANMLLFSEIGFDSHNTFVSVNNYLASQGLLKYDPNSGAPDYKNSIAFESVQGTNGININRKSVYSQGTVSDKEYLDVVHSVMQSLKQMPNPYNNNPMFRDVVPGKQIYKGEQIPDIILEPYDWKYLFFGDVYWSNFVHRNCQTGWHRQKSIVGLAGDNISNIRTSEPHQLTNILPTIYQMLKVDPNNSFISKGLFN